MSKGGRGQDGAEDAVDGLGLVSWSAGEVVLNDMSCPTLMQAVDCAFLVGGEWMLQLRGCLQRRRRQVSRRVLLSRTRLQRH